jgi:hypothetical protein
VILLASVPWWSTFPWGSVGAVGVVMGFVIGALKLAVMFGAERQRGVDHERRLLTLEGKADGVPDEVDHEVSQRYHSVESAAEQLRKNLTQLFRAVRQLQRSLDFIRWRCESINGPPSQVMQSDDVSDELTLEPPTAAGDKP